jgi:hypothetical protein
MVFAEEEVITIPYQLLYASPLATLHEFDDPKDIPYILLL